jgi:hypothetical protein
MDVLGVIAVTVSPVLIAIIGWFIIQFIQRHDEFKKEITTKLDTHSEEMKKETSKVQAAVEVLHQDVTDSQQIMLNFKSTIQDELYKVKIETRSMISDLKIAGENVKALNLLCEKTEKTLVDHQKIIQITAKAVVAHRDELAKLRSDNIKINEDLMLIKKKKE